MELQITVSEGCQNELTSMVGMPAFVDELTKLVREQRKCRVTNHNPWEVLLIYGPLILTKSEWIDCAHLLSSYGARKPDVYICCNTGPRYSTFCEIMRGMNVPVIISRNGSNELRREKL